jgi:hypothetical protein
VSCPEILLVLACSVLQEPTDAPRGSNPGQPKQPRAVRNQVHVQLEYHYDEDHPQRHQQHPGSPYVFPPHGIPEVNNQFSFHANYYFEGKPQMTVSPPPRLTMTLGGGARNWAVGADSSLVSSVSGNPLNLDPIVPTKPGALGGTGDSDEEDSDSGFLYGPDFDYLVEPDVTAWSPAAWLPKQTSFHLYVRALLGDVELYGVETDLQIYSAGPRLRIPIFAANPLRLGATVSAGPAYAHTDIGDAAGIEFGAGLRSELFATKSLVFVLALGLDAFSSNDAFAWGPSLNLGLNVGW